MANFKSDDKIEEEEIELSEGIYSMIAKKPWSMDPLFEEDIFKKTKSLLDSLSDTEKAVNKSRNGEEKGNIKQGLNDFKSLATGSHNIIRTVVNRIDILNQWGIGNVATLKAEKPSDRPAIGALKNFPDNLKELQSHAKWFSQLARFVGEMGVVGSNSASFSKGIIIVSTMLEEKFLEAQQKIKIAKGEHAEERSI